jgi:sRNA-binding carbon storage regulator CsrA
MLVITRKNGESFVLFDETGRQIAKVTLVQRIGDSKIRLGIDALPEFKIWRSELVKDSSQNGDKSPNS